MFIMFQRVLLEVNPFENWLIVSMIVCSSSYYSSVGGFLSYKQMIWSRHKNWNYFRLLEWKKISWADEKRDLFYDLHFQRTAKEKFQMMSVQLFYGKLVKIVKPFIECGSYYSIYYLVKKTQLSKSNLKCKWQTFKSSSFRNSFCKQKLN